MDRSSAGAVDPADLAALIGVLAVLQGRIYTGEVSADAVVALGQRLVIDAGRQDEDIERHVRQALDDLGQRLRYAAGEYDVPPESEPVAPSQPRG
ncbi:hypothetical protein [Promicromonospora sp. NPDC050262]|uniref:hypothetical protein n=1 Tax=Promicromonospora sp. NPDC050262 TaxID=3155036 RepID=UPI0033FD10E2